MLNQQIRKLWTDESGATAVEYGLMVAAIAAVIIATVFALGDTVNTKFTSVNSAINSH